MIPPKKSDSCECGGTFNLSYIDGRSVIDQNCKKPPYHKKKRIGKKQIKRWKEKNIGYIVGAAIVGLMTPHFKCDKCGKTEGYYGHLGRTLTGIEPMAPPAGLHFYLKAKYDPETKKVLT